MRPNLTRERLVLVRKAFACAVAIPAAFFVGDQLIGGSAVAVFSMFGGFALLVFARFSGDRLDQALRYLGLGLVGYLAITAGTLLASPTWLAAISMFVVGSVVTLAGSFSATAAGGGRSVLLAFILALVVPGGPEVIPERLLGWTIAFSICVPAAILLLPPHDRRILRRGIGSVCRSIARVLAGLRDGSADVAAVVGDIRREADELRARIESPETRPIGPSARSRSLIRSVPLMEAAADILEDAVPEPHAWTRAEAALLTDGQRLLEGLVDGPLAARTRSSVEAASVATTTTDLWAYMLAAIRGPRGMDTARTGWLVAIVTTVLAAARLLDPASRVAQRHRRLPPLPRVIGSYVAFGSVPFRHAARVGIGLAVAVAVADSLPFENAFWVVLATLTALSTNLFGTTTSASRAVLGTLIGFVASVVVLAIVGEGQLALWLLLPIAVLLAVVAPTAISFTAGQAAFTVAVVFIFDIANPAISNIGVARLEDVIAGSIIAVIVAASLWPHGAGRAADAAAVDAVRAAAGYLGRAVDGLVHGADLTTDELDRVSLRVHRFNDARRHFRVEHGADIERLTRLVACDDTVLCILHAADEILSLGPMAQPHLLTGSREALSGLLEGVLHGTVGAGGAVGAGGPLEPDDAAALAFMAQLREESAAGDADDDAVRLATAWIWLRNVARFLRRRDYASVDAVVAMGSVAG